MTDTPQSPTLWEGIQVEGQVFDIELYNEQGGLVENPNLYCLVNPATSNILTCWFEPSAFPSIPKRPGNGKVNEV